MQLSASAPLQMLRIVRLQAWCPCLFGACGNQPGICGCQTGMRAPATPAANEYAVACDGPPSSRSAGGDEELKLVQPRFPGHESSTGSVCAPRRRQEARLREPWCLFDSLFTCTALPSMPAVDQEPEKGEEPVSSTGLFDGRGL